MRMDLNIVADYATCSVFSYSVVFLALWNDR